MSVKDNLVIYDWDDTFLPTTEITKIIDANKNNVTDIQINTSVSIKLLNLDHEILKLLRTSIERKYVVIITNAQLSWLHITGERFLPKSYKFIIDNKITIISAAEKYGHITPRVIEWKFNTIKDYLNDNKQFKSVSSIGDSECERTAILTIKDEKIKGFPSKFNTFKMLDSPSYDDLYRQIMFINTFFYTILDEVEDTEFTSL